MMSELTQPTQVLGYLFLGGKAAAKSKDALQQLNIKYILNCTPRRTEDRENGCPSFFEKEQLFTYKRIPIFDNRGEDILSYMDDAFRFIEEGKHYGNVLVHCHKGVSRSASFVIGYLMRKNGFTCDEALCFLQGLRPAVQPNESFLEQLRRYQPSQDQEHDGSAGSVSTATTEHAAGPQMPSADDDGSAPKRRRIESCPPPPPEPPQPAADRVVYKL